MKPIANPAKDVIATNYNRMSKGYNAIAGPSEKQLRRAGLRQLGAAPGETILEIGFGTGHSLLEIAEAVGDTGKVCGIDVSSRMVEIAEARAAAAGYSRRIELACVNAITIPYEECTFDGLFMNFTLEVFEQSEIKMLLQQCRKVLRPGGRICIVAMFTKGKHGTMMKLYEWAHAKFPNTSDCRPINVGELIRGAGFDVTEDTVTSFWGLSVEMVLSYKGMKALVDV
jgi:ubiquinone/menaquinone biosynthesis C-methylase UbiE